MIDGFSADTIRLFKLYVNLVGIKLAVMSCDKIKNPHQRGRIRQAYIDLHNSIKPRRNK